MKHALIVTDADRTLLTLLGGPAALRRALARATVVPAAEVHRTWSR